MIVADSVVRRFPKRSFVFRQGEPAAAMYRLRRGLVKIFTVDENGRERVLRILFPEAVFGFSMLADGRHYASAETLDDSLIEIFDRERLLGALERHPETAKRLLGEVADRLRRADEQTVAGHASFERKLAQALLFFLDKCGGASATFRLPVSYRELAAMTDAAPETLSRKLALLQAKGLVSIGRNRSVTLPDPEALRRFAETEVTK